MNKKVVFDFFDNKITSIQRKELEDWLKVNNNKEVFYEWLNEYEENNLQFKVNTENKLLETKKRILESEKVKSEYINIQSGKNKILFLVAASVLFFLGLAWFKSSLVINNSLGSDLVIVNVRDESKIVNFPDNSSVVLNSNSSVKYSKNDFKSGNRRIYFEGEGFFEIKKDISSPFLINTKFFNTKVLGTSFSLKTSEVSNENEIKVKTGKVAIYDNRNKLNFSNEVVYLSENQLLKLTNERVSITQASNIDFTKERQHLIPDLVFENKLVSEVLDSISKYYNVKILYDSSQLQDCRITASLSDEPFIEKIHLICLAIDAVYEFDQQKVTIKANGCNSI